MTTATFDTLKYAEQLKVGGFNDVQIRAQVQALSEIFDTDGRALATKQDVAHLEHSTEVRFDSLRKEMATKEDLNKLKEDLSRLEIATKRDFGKLELRISETKADLLKWMAGFAVAHMTLLIAIAAFFMTR